jgi:hypothetical protein
MTWFGSEVDVGEGLGYPVDLLRLSGESEGLKEVSHSLGDDFLRGGGKRSINTSGQAVQSSPISCPFSPNASHQLTFLKSNSSMYALSTSTFSGRPR